MDAEVGRTDPRASFGINLEVTPYPGGRDAYAA
jgi:hypothetical protein